MNIDENTAVVTPESNVSEQSADVQAQDSNVTALEEFMAEPEETTGDDQGATEETAEAEKEQPTEEASIEEVPKGIKGRILKAEEKADKRGYERAQSEWANEKAELQRRIAEYEAKELEAEIEKEAAKLARDEHISIGIARRLLRAERGVKPIEQTSEKSADTAISKTNEAPVLSNQRKDALNSQAEQIKNRYGIDVLELVTEDDAKAIFDGKMELWDVAMRAGKKEEPTPKKPAPTPVKSSATNAPTGGMDFLTMSDEDFDKFNAKIARGAVYHPRN